MQIHEITHTHAYIYIYMCVCVCVCLCIYILEISKSENNSKVVSVFVQLTGSPLRLVGLPISLSLPLSLSLSQAFSVKPLAHLCRWQIGRGLNLRALRGRRIWSRLIPLYPKRGPPCIPLLRKRSEFSLTSSPIEVRNSLSL